MRPGSPAWFGHLYYTQRKVIETDWAAYAEDNASANTHYNELREAEIAEDLCTPVRTNVDICKTGRHPMVGRNAVIHSGRGWRYCRACHDEYNQENQHADRDRGDDVA